LALPPSALHDYGFIDHFVRGFAKNVHLEFRRVVTQEDFIALGQARLRMYAQYADYYRTLFPDETGLDDRDARSFVFACYSGGDIIGSVRVTPYPFETMQYVEEAALAAFLGVDYATSYVEFSRLLVDRKFPGQRLAEAQASAAAAVVALSSRFRNYFGYLKRRLKPPLVTEADVLRFRIKERKNNEYVLAKGRMVDTIARAFSIEPRDEQYVLECLRHQVESYRICNHTGAAQ